MNHKPPAETRPLENGKADLNGEAEEIGEAEQNEQENDAPVQNDGQDDHEELQVD